MPPIRFRIRTIMITIAAAAVLMGVFRWLPIGVRANLITAILVGVFAEILVYCACLWPGTTPRDKYLSGPRRNRGN
jgi:hypothetical protein